jgi:hypothetical protein
MPGPIILVLKPENFERIAELSNRTVEELERNYAADRQLDQIRNYYFDTRLAYEEVKR